MHLIHHPDRKGRGDRSRVDRDVGEGYLYPLGIEALLDLVHDGVLELEVVGLYEPHPKEDLDPRGRKALKTMRSYRLVRTAGRFSATAR